MKNKKKFLIVGAILVALLSVVGGTYAYFSIGGTQSSSNVLKSGCLRITLNNVTNNVSLTNAAPMTDVEGLSTDPYTFTVYNSCSTQANYSINLESITTTLATSYVRVGLSSDTFDNVVTTLSNNTSTTAQISGATGAYILYKGVISGNTTKTFNLRLWVDNDATISQAASKTYASKINVIATPADTANTEYTAKFTQSGTSITGALSSNVSTAYYCLTDTKCTPSTSISISSNQVSYTIGDSNEKRIFCTKLNSESRMFCSNPIGVINPKNNIVIQASINGALSSTFPTSSSSGYMPVSVSCTNGATGTFNYSSWKVEVDTNKGTTCTVDFRTNPNQTFANYLMSKKCSTTPTTDYEAQNCLVEENGYRFEGEDPNNYVLFNNELWRVIGVIPVQLNGTTSYSNLVKIIRAEVLDGLAWNASGSTTWSGSYLQTALNSYYSKSNNTSCYIYTGITKTCYFSNNGLDTTYRNMVAYVKWNTGTVSTSNPNTMYTNETSGTKTASYVALMSASDYGYGVLASNCARTTSVGSYNTSSCAGKNWLKNGSPGYEWLLTPRSSGYVLGVFGSGHVNSYCAPYDGYGVRPSVYLQSGIYMKGGNGSIDNPYIIG